MSAEHTAQILRGDKVTRKFARRHNPQDHHHRLYRRQIVYRTQCSAYLQNTYYASVYGILEQKYCRLRYVATAHTVINWNEPVQ
jgi:hypothetical protein